MFLLYWFGTGVAVMLSLPLLRWALRKWINMPKRGCALGTLVRSKCHGCPWERWCDDDETKKGE